MKKLGLALRTLLRVLRDSAFAARVAALSEPTAKLSESPSESVKAASEAALPRRNEALTLLALLQREARLVDFLQESIDGYSDAQIGAAAREVHHGSRKVIEQVFGLEPVRSEAENSTITIPVGFEAGEYQLSGNLVGEPPYAGALRHHGWRVTRCELPAWTGTERASKVVAPAEVELK